MAGIVFDGWGRVRGKKNKGNLLDFGESPLAYKDIENVMAYQADLVEPLVKLYPLGVVKG